jgi:phage major head subunit gpT-like protein
MRTITARDYQRLSSNLWWNSVAPEISITGARERLVWLLDTAKIEYVNKLGGEQNFEDVLTHTTEYEAKSAAAALKLQRTQLDDTDGPGVGLAQQWSSTIGQYAAYWPQKQVATAVRNGGLSTSLAYDGLPFFSASHLLNPLDPSSAVFANDFTGAASGAYPGACPINGVTLDVAFTNLQKVFTYIRSIKMINGEDPRFLRPKAIMVPPALSTIAQQLTNAKYIAQAAASGGGSGDVEAVVRNWGIGQPIECDEFGAGFTNGSDTTYYVLVEQIGAGELGPLTYLNREPFTVHYLDGMTDQQLLMADELVWKCRGRNVVGYGHPYLLFRVRAT